MIFTCRLLAEFSCKILRISVLEIIPLPCPWFKLKEHFLSRLRKGRNGSSPLLSHSINSTPSKRNTHNWAFFIREVTHGKIIMHLWYNLTSCVHFSSHHPPHSHPHTLHLLCSVTLYFSCAKSLQSCLTLGDPVNCILPGSSVHGLLEYWSGLPCPPPGDLSEPRIEL